MIRFIGNNPDGLPQKRSQSLRACDSCRKRKKRCVHGPATEYEIPTASMPSHGDTPSSAVTQSSLVESSHQTNSSSGSQSMSRPDVAFMPLADDGDDDPESDGGNGDRFVGDLNPTSIFLAAAHSQGMRSAGEDEVGIWISRKTLDGFGRQPRTNAAPQLGAADPLISNVLLPYMQRQYQQLLPQPDNYEALYRIYVLEIHAIFPVIDLDSLRQIKSQSNLLALKQAICLAASSSPRATVYLQLSSSYDGTVVNDPTSFSTQLASAIRSSIDMGFVRDRVVIVQVMTVLALFSQFSAQSNLSAEFTARAISHMQTMGLHLHVPAVTRSNETYLTRLFGCVWVLDRLNAAFQGRPIMIHEHDFNRSLSSMIINQDSCFRLMLRVTSILDMVIALYRPTGDRSNLIIPSFEDLINECDATRISPGLLATVELLYHAVIMLSCRTKTPMQIDPDLKIREIHSATNVVSILGTEFHDRISHLPFAPYALSLSLRVFYRELRFNCKSPFTQTRARNQLLNACKLLRESFSDKFPSAMKIAQLAEQTIQEMDRIYKNIIQQHNNPRSASETVDSGHYDRSQGTSSDAADTAQTPDDPGFTVYDASAVEGLPDLNVFDFFDSDFHLDEVDAAFINNMAMTFSPAVHSEVSMQESV